MVPLPLLSGMQDGDDGDNDAWSYQIPLLDMYGECCRNQTLDSCGICGGPARLFMCVCLVHVTCMTFYAEIR
jgi:hypothetical protein